MRNNMKKILIMCLAVTLYFGTFFFTTNVEAAHQFKDVKVNDYYYEDVQKLLQLGAISAAEKFNPKNNVTRGQLAKMMAISLNLNTKNVKDPKFKDVSKKHQFYPYIAALANKGIIKGYANGNFGVNDTVKRSHLAKFVVEGYGLEKRISNVSFKDVKVGTEFDTYLKTIYFHIEDFDQVIKAKYPDKFKYEILVEPNKNATRAEVAMFIAKSIVAKEIQLRTVAIPSEDITNQSIDKYRFSSLYGVESTVKYNYDILNNELVLYGIKEGKSFIYAQLKDGKAINFDVDKNLNVSYKISDEVLPGYKKVSELRISGKSEYTDAGEIVTRMKEVTFTDYTVTPPVITTVQATNSSDNERIVYKPKASNNLVDVKVTYVDNSQETIKYYIYDTFAMVQNDFVKVGDAKGIELKNILYISVDSKQDESIIPQNDQKFELIYEHVGNIDIISGLYTSDTGKFLINSELNADPNIKRYLNVVKIDGIYHAYLYYEENLGRK